MKTDKQNGINQARREAWLKQLKAVTLLVVERDSLLQDCCPYMRHISTEEKAKTLRDISNKSKEITESVQKLLKIEQGCLGVTALLSGKISEEVALTVYCAIGARLDGTVDRSFRRVQDYTAMVAARDPVLSLKVRNLFRSDSVLDPYIALGSSGVNLDEKLVAIRESSLNRALGQDQDRNTILCDAELIPNRRI